MSVRSGLRVAPRALKAGADVYDFFSRQTESTRRRRVKELEKQNALLRRKVLEIQAEIAQLHAAVQRKSSDDEQTGTGLSGRSIIKIPLMR